MRVAIYDVDQDTGDETFVRRAWLEEVCPEPAEQDDIREDIETAGDVMVGGGAAPLVRIAACQ